MAQLIYQSLCSGNYPESHLQQYGQVRFVNLSRKELGATFDPCRRCYRMLFNEGMDKEAAIFVRVMVENKQIVVISTDSPAIQFALRPDPEHVNLLWCVRRFKENNRGRWETFWEAHGACRPVSFDFFHLLQEKKVVTQEMVKTGKAGVYEGPFAGAAQGWHCFPYIGRLVIDWTYRQIDENCKIPHIYLLPKDHHFPVPYVDYNPRAFESW